LRKLKKTRPEFSGEERTGIWANGVFVELSVEEGGKAPITTYFSPYRRLLRTLLGVPFILIVIVFVIVATLAIIIIRILLQKNSESLAVVASIINAIIIIFLNYVYKRIAVVLTDWENHRTDSDYEDALIVKTFAFQFVNSYVSLFYIAYFKQYVDVVGKYKDQCNFNSNCIQELLIQLATILVINIVFGQIQEVGISYIRNILKARDDKDRAAKSHAELSKQDQKEFKKTIVLSKVERESNHAPFDGTFGEYDEMVIQYGYVTMFAAAFPLAPLLAFLNNIVEIRSDAFKLLKSTQRPFYQGAQDIGTWYKILNIIGFVAVLTNCLLISITSPALENRYFLGIPNSEDVAALLATIIAAIVLEHLIILTKFIVSEIIPDEPEWVRIALARQNYLKNLLLEGEEDKEEGKVQVEFDDTITAEDEAQ